MLPLVLATTTADLPSGAAPTEPATTTFVGPAPTPLLVVPRGQAPFGLPLHPHEAWRCAVPCTLELEPGPWRVRAGDEWTGGWTTIVSGPAPASYSVRPSRRVPYLVGMGAAGAGFGLLTGTLLDMALSRTFGNEPRPSDPWLAGGGAVLVVGGAALGFANRAAVRPGR